MFTSSLSRIARSSSSAVSKKVFQNFASFHSSRAVSDKLNVEGLAEKVNLEGQNVLMRVDLNVPLSKEVSF